MREQIYRYVFDTSAQLADVEATLLLALLATESLHGETDVRLEAAHAFDARQRAVVIDAGGGVGRDLNRLFAGFVRREFGEDAFDVERVKATTSYFRKSVGDDREAGPTRPASGQSRQRRREKATP